MKMTSVPAPPPLPEPRASPAGTFLKKSMSHSLVFANSSEPSLVSKQRKTTTKNHDPKALKCLEPNGIPPKTKKKKIVRRAHSFDDSNNTPNSPRRASNRKEFLKSKSLPDSKANVTFSHQNSVYEIERVRDVPSITDSDIWWTAKDYLEIKQEYEAVIYLLEQNLPVNELEHSTRGLDKRTERGAWTMFEHQRNARNAVLRQQDIQRKLKYVDETAIAQAYMKETSVLIQQAIQVAAVDAKIACSFIHSNSTSTEEQNPAAESTDYPVPHIRKSVIEVSSPPQTPISTKKPALSPSKMQSPQSPTCWHDSIGFVGCHKAGRSKAAIRDSIVNSYLAAWQQPLNNNDLLKDSIASKKSNKSYVSEDNSLVMSDTDSDFNDTTEVDSFSHIDAVELFDAKEDKTVSHIDDHTSMRVRFAKKVKKIKRIKVKDVAKDTERRWYSKSELISIAHVVNNVIEMMEKETRLAENDLVMEEKYNETRRGLEKSTETGAWKLFERRREAINSVLVLQSQQRRDNMMNSTALAEGYKAATKEACQEAIKFGKQDAKEAKKYRLKRRSVCDEASSSKKSTQHPVGSDGPRPKSTERSYENSSSHPHSQDSSEDADMCDLSVRSLLDLDEEPSSTPEYNVDNINRIKSRSHRRMSASHPPSRRFVLATAAIFDSTQKSVEHKETSCSPGRIKSKDRNVVVMSWRRNSTRSISTDSVATASDTNLLTAMDASVIDDFDVIYHEFTEQSSEGLRRLNAVEAVTDNDVVTKEESTQENLSIKRQPETVNGRVPDTSKDPLFGLLEDATPPHRSETAELIQSVEARHKSEKATDVPITCSDKENQHIAGNIDAVAQLESNLDSVAPIWFKVHPSDVRMIKLQDGDVAYLLKNPEKYCLPPSIV